MYIYFYISFYVNWQTLIASLLALHQSLRMPGVHEITFRTKLEEATAKSGIKPRVVPDSYLECIRT